MARTKKVDQEKVVETEVKEEKKVSKGKKAKKVEKVEKKVEKVEEPKPVVKEAKALARDVRVTPRKVRLVIDIVRGKNVDEALGILKNVNKAASNDVFKLIKSAASNAANNFHLDWNKLYVKEIQAGDGVKMKRYLPRAKGSSSGLVKRCSNIRVTVAERE